MAVEENKAIVRRWYEGLLGDDPTVVDEMLSESFKYHFQDEPVWDREKSKSWYEKAIKEQSWKIQGVLVDMIAEGDRVAVWIDLQDGQKRSLIHKIVAGKIAETRQACRQTE